MRKNVTGQLGRRDFLGLSAAGGLGLISSSLASAQFEGQVRPNLILIVADDLGNHDLGCQGGTEIPTPNIDSLAAGGVRFTNGYVSCPVCSPTRAGLLTGRYQQRFGHEFNPGPIGSEHLNRETFGLPLDQTTLADHLKGMGYKTGMVGKWHLGLTERHHPCNRGFEEYFGFLHGSHPYLDLLNPKHEPIYRNLEKTEETAYLTDAFARESVAFIERNKAKPFFLYLSFNAVHSPMEAPPKYLDRFPNIQNEKRRKYAAMLSAMDDAVGAVLDKLRAEGLAEKTLIAFISDNGGPIPNNASDNGIYRATKGTVYEGGIRVPYMLHWPARLPKGKTVETPVISLDLLPTFLVSAGQMPAEGTFDGVNILWHAMGEEKGEAHEALFWRFGTRKAIRKGNWKMLRRADKPWELYDLAKDPGETTDLAAKEEATVASLLAAYTDWEKGLIAPKWGGKGIPKWQEEEEDRPPGSRRG